MSVTRNYKVRMSMLTSCQMSIKFFTLTPSGEYVPILLEITEFFPMNLLMNLIQFSFEKFANCELREMFQFLSMTVLTKLSFSRSSVNHLSDVKFEMPAIPHWGNELI